jgi:hypothetical protein
MMRRKQRQNLKETGFETIQNRIKSDLHHHTNIPGKTGGHHINYLIT